MKTVESFRRFNKSIGIILFLIIVFVVIGFFVVYPNIVKAMQPSYFSSSVTYRLTIRNEAPLFNVTLLIPLPVRDKLPAVGILNLTESMFEKSGYNASFVQVNGDRFLRLTAETVLPDRGYEVTYGDNDLRIDYTGLGRKIEYKNAADYPYWIDTRNPLRNETVFLPKNNVIIQVPTEPTYSIYYNPVLSRYQTNVFAEYQTSTGTPVNIFVSIKGQNEWTEEFGAWRGNSYSDYFEESLTGPARGWHLANGELKSGEGKFLDRIH